MQEAIIQTVMLMVRFSMAVLLKNPNFMKGLTGWLKVLRIIVLH